MDAFIALGSNLGDRGGHLSRGLRGLRGAGLALADLSSVWETEPVDATSPAWFWNMAARFDTRLRPIELLDLMLEIERDNGRRRAERNGPRTLDLDLLLLGDLRADDARLTLPHPRMWRRAFVLAPLAEIAPGLRDPSTGLTVAEHLRRVRDASEVRRLGPLYTAEAVPL